MPRRYHIEDIILSHDRRGISSMRPFLPSRFCDEAAELIVGNSAPGKTALIITGFFIPSAKAAETDGPPGALALADALEKTGIQPLLVCDKFSKPLLTIHGHRVIAFPIKDDKGSRKKSESLLKETRPSMIISVERCGMTQRGQYLNMRGIDISAYNARLDYLFIGQRNTIGIGDGGNEIGMGILADKLKSAHNLPSDPCVIEVERLILSSVSNWGAYGLIASLSARIGSNLLPSLDWQSETLRKIVERGAVDGITGERKCSVDGFSEEQNAHILARLHRIVEEKLARPG